MKECQECYSEIANKVILENDYEALKPLIAAFVSAYISKTANQMFNNLKQKTKKEDVKE